MKPNKIVLQMSRHILVVLLLVFMTVSLTGGAQVVNAQNANMPPTGMICTSNSSSTFTLTTQTGYISLPDGNVVYMWGFSEGGGAFQHPSPILCVNEGDLVTVVLNNTLNQDVSLIFPGQENVMANGSLSQPVFDAAGELVSLAPVAAMNGGSMTYSFVANKPGTFIYESGTEPSKQVNMGLFGALVVRPSADGFPTTGQNGIPIAYAYNDLDSAYNPDTEYVIIMSEIDPMLHVAVEQGYLYNMNNYTPRYWLYNGRAFPDTVASNGAGWLPTQPFGSLVYLHPTDLNPTLGDGSANPAYNPYPTLIRHLSVGTQDFPHHPHGNHGRVIAQDGHLLKSGADDMSFEKFTVTISPGQTQDSLFHWLDVEGWNPIDPDKEIPVVIPQLQDLTVGQFYSGSPYLGYTDTLPVGMQALNQCGEYYHIAHSHALHQITAWGMVLSGHITFARIDPPLPNGCP
jgi:FtsP/CotA-like multicopper oxidase with cupredoxin domain